MFRNLRNKLLIVNTAIIAALLICSFSVIYLTVAQNTMRDINQKLERSIMFARNDRADDMRREPRGEADMRQREALPEDGMPPEIPAANHDLWENQMFSLTFTIVTDADGNIEKTNMPFELNDDFYSEKTSAFIKAGNGHVKSDTGYWAYKTVSANGGQIIAFTEISAEHTIMRNLLLVLILVAILALSAAFLICLFSANRSIRPVEESYNKQKQFVADASHELKTPLTTINTNVDVLLSHEDNTIREEKKWLGYIKTETERMTKLTNDLLYLARLDHNENEVMLSRTSFSDAAESVILLMEAVIFEKNINMTYDIEHDLYVNGSAEQLKQIVMILIDNAAKYTPKTGNIWITLKKDVSDAVFTVRNTGEGISEEALKHVFERFYREDKSRARKSGGYGLGLAIAHAIVKSYKGSITAASEKNGFTEFTVKIPLTK